MTGQKSSVTLRTKLVLVSLVLLLLPWLGLNYLNAVESLLHQQQAQKMATIAKATAILVSEYGEQLSLHNNTLNTKSQAEPATLISIDKAINIDGYQDDWSSYRGQLTSLPADNQLISGHKIDPQDISARYLLAHNKDELSVLIEVVDDSIVFRDASKQQRHGGDAIILAFTDKAKRVYRYILSSSAFGHINVYHYIGSYLDPVIIGRQSAIQAAWRQTQYGYRLELSLPSSMLDHDIALAVIDVDHNENKPKVIGLGDVRNNQLFTPLVMPSIALSTLLAKMTDEGIRIWLVDKKRNILAQAGQATILVNEAEIDSVVDLISQLLFEAVVSDDGSLSHQQAVLAGSAVGSALNGKAASQRQQLNDRSTSITVASQPVLIDNITVAAVVVEQNSNAILTVQNQAAKTLFQSILLIFAIIVLLLFAFASRLSYRIARLNKDIKAAVSGEGRVSADFKQRNEYDELGQLRQSFGHLFQRLSHYTHYLEALASRLTHELRTPIAVISTSLEHLQAKPKDQQIYIDRAGAANERLTNIVARMSEASRLEQSIQDETLTEFDLNKLLVDLIPVYQDIYPEVKIEFATNSEAITINGSQELLVQMLDKLLANAIDFHTDNTAIEISLRQHQQYCTLVVKNHGKHLEKEMQTQIFQAMVSIRPDNYDAKQAHLGLGLYMVKLIVELHHGKVIATNWQDGVELSIELPITTTMAKLE